MVATERGVDVERILLFYAPELTAVVLTVPDGLARMQDALRTRPWVALCLTTAARPGGEPDTPLPPAALAGTVVVRNPN